MNELDALRKRILEIDEGMLQLWKERDDAARRVGQIKQAQGLPVQNYEVEKAVLDHAVESAIKLGVNVDRTRVLVRMLIESSITVQERDRVRRAAKDGRKALIVGGAGLMGGWFARFLEEQGYQVFVDDPRPSPYPPATKGAALDLILIAAPPSTVPRLLKVYAKWAKGQTLLADIASIKGSTATTLRELATAGVKVASLHPMFGPGAEVLMGRNVLVLDCGNKDAVQSAKALFANTTVRLHELPVEEHDPFMAELLGLSHATSLLFNESLATSPIAFDRLEPLSSTTFRKQVEVSREVARENPKLYYEIQALNPQSSKMFDRIEKALKTLRNAVEKRDDRAFLALMSRAKTFYEGGRPRAK